MAKIIYGYLSFGVSLLAALIALFGFIVVFSLPPATYLFRRIFYIVFGSFILGVLGLIFYYLQWRIFTTRIVNSALIISIITLAADIYFLYELYLVI